MSESRKRSSVWMLLLSFFFLGFILFTVTPEFSFKKSHCAGCTDVAIIHCSLSTLHVLTDTDIAVYRG